MKFCKKLPAFALLEMAIALSVLGILGYMTLPLLSKIQQWQKVKTTHAHQEKIMEALAGYVLANKHLPCPALTTNGQAQAVCTNETKAGFVPYQTLGIEAKTAKDGYHHWMTYVVQPRLTHEKIRWIQPMSDLRVDPKTIFCKVSPDETLKVLNEQHQTCVETPDFVAVVLISHGTSGGYMLENGIVQPAVSLDSDKVMNTMRGDHYITKAPQYRDASIFDDTVLFVSRNNLMAQWAKVPCQH
ncbi:MAG: type II secretion system protein [Pseudomonadota bacterium]|jgi:type II secretory pathway pseudopilin PulG|nr:type II secretion system GspH family protein [Alphaproteobacteria bacterium]